MYSCVYVRLSYVLSCVSFHAICILVTFSYVTLFITFVLLMDVCKKKSCLFLCINYLFHVILVHIVNIVCTLPHYESWHTKRNWLCG